MSARNQQNQKRKPGVASTKKPNSFSRRHEHKRVRRSANVALAQLQEPEDMALPRPVNTTVKADPSDKPAKVVQRRRFKVWKTKAWKRRSLNRAHKAEQYRRAGDRPIEVFE